MGSPIPRNSEHWVSEADLRTESVQTTNKADTQLGLVPKKTSHTWTHTMGEGEGKKVLKTKWGEKKKGWEAGSTLTGPHMNVWEKKTEKSFPRLAQEKGCNFLIIRKDHELWLYGERRWLWFLYKTKQVLFLKIRNALMSIFLYVEVILIEAFVWKCME